MLYISTVQSCHRPFVFEEYWHDFPSLWDLGNVFEIHLEVPSHLDDGICDDVIKDRYHLMDQWTYLRWMLSDMMPCLRGDVKITPPSLRSHAYEWWDFRFSYYYYYCCCIRVSWWPGCSAISSEDWKRRVSEKKIFPLQVQAFMSSSTCTHSCMIDVHPDILYWMELSDTLGIPNSW